MGFGRWIRRRLPALLLAVCCLLVAGSLLAQDDVTDDEVNDVASQLYCPVCESTPLDVCPTQACADWRELIRTQLSAGATHQEVLDYFARQYGDGVLANPPRRGVGLIMLWILPVVGIGLAAVLFARVLRGMHTPVAAEAVAPAAAAPPPPKPTGETAGLDEYMARIEQELDE